MKTGIAVSGVDTPPHNQVCQQRHSVPLATVLQYQNSAVVARIAKDLTLTQTEAEQLFRDTLMFLWLAAKFGGVVPPPQIDEGWHAFILFTKGLSGILSRAIRNVSSSSAASS